MNNTSRRSLGLALERVSQNDSRLEGRAARPRALAAEHRRATNRIEGLQHILIALSLIIAADPIRSETVRLRPVADTTLFEAAPTNNLGGVMTLAAGTTARGKQSRALLHFDVISAIPSNASVVEATLTLSVVRAPAGGGGENSLFALHRMLRSWVEGNKATEANGSPATSGEPTWLASAHPSDVWREPGAAATEEFVETASATQFVSSLASYEFSGLAVDVEHWRSHPAENFGWLLLSQAEGTPATARRFGAREDHAQTPELRIEFVRSGPAAPRLSDVVRAGAGLRFQFQAEAHVPYAVEWRVALAAAPWSTLTNIAAAPAPRNVVVSDVPGPINRFYRAVAR